MADGIQLSRNLVYQLVDADEKSKKRTKKTKPKVPRESQQSQKKVQQKEIPNTSEVQKGTPSAGWPLQPPFFLPTSPPSSNPELEAIRSVLKESESVLEKLQTHEENMLKKVTQRAKELHEKEFKIPHHKTILCQPEKDACVSCYKEHVKDPLKCSTVVSTYQECVRRARKQAKVPS